MLNNASITEQLTTIENIIIDMYAIHVRQFLFSIIEPFERLMT